MLSGPKGSVLMPKSISNGAQYVVILHTKNEWRKSNLYPFD